MRKKIYSISTVIFFLYTILVCNRAEAYSAGGYVELDYSNFDSNSKDNTTGTVMKTKTTEFTQQYNMNLNLDPFPNISIASGVLITNDLTKATVGGLYTESSDDTVRPFIDIRLRDPLGIYYGEAGYSFQKTTTTGSPDLYNEVYNARAGWSPLAFPTLPLPTFGLQATRNNLYDQNRTFEDTTTDTVQFNTHYKPVMPLDLGYDAILTKSNNQINQLGTDVLNQDARVNYTDNFWNHRVLVSTGYIIGFNDTKTSQQGQGTVSFPLFPFTGLSNVTDIPTTETLNPNPALIDGNLTVSAGLNIGSSPSLAGDSKFREMGLDFDVATQVNNLQIWVNQPLTPAIANSFAWDIYTSADNVTWTFFQTVFPAPFGPFTNNFNLNFSNVLTRYIKVATRPLVLTVQGATDPNNQNILVTELQAFSTKSAQSVSGQASEESQLYNATVSMQLFEGLYLVSSYNGSQSSFTTNGVETTSRSYSLSNSLNLTRHFNVGPGLTLAALVGRVDNVTSSGPSTGTYNYGATLSAVPFKTLRSSLVYGGSTEDNGAKSDSLTLNETADLYQGVSLSSSIGVASSLSYNGVRTDGVNFLTTAGVAPRRDLTFSATYQKNTSESYGGIQQLGIYSILERYDIGVTYRPFQTVYLTADIGDVSRTGTPNQRSENFGLNWSPLLTGNLQFNFIYTDGYVAYLNQQTKVIGPTIEWRLLRSATLEVSYFVTEAYTSLANTTVDNLYIQFKMSL
jgi:hypothetical protein